VSKVNERIAACDESAQILDEPVDATAGSQSLGDGALESSAFQTAQKIGDVLSVECQSRLGGQGLSERRRDQRLFGRYLMAGGLEQRLGPGRHQPPRPAILPRIP